MIIITINKISASVGGAYLKMLRLCAAVNVCWSNSAADWARRTLFLCFLRNDDLTCRERGRENKTCQISFATINTNTNSKNKNRARIRKTKERKYGRTQKCNCGRAFCIYLEWRIWQNRSCPVVSNSFGWSLSSAPRRFIDEYKLNILNGLTFFELLATSHTRTSIFRLLLYTELIVLYTKIDTERGDCCCCGADGCCCCCAWFNCRGSGVVIPYDCVVWIIRSKREYRKVVII